MFPAPLERMHRGHSVKKSSRLVARAKRVIPFLFMFLGISGIALLGLNAEIGSSNMNLSSPDREFIQKAAMTGLTEVALGKLAMEKSQNGEVRVLGQRLMADREALNADFQRLARKKGVEAPVFLDDRHQGRVTALSILSVEDFDKAFLKTVTRMHEKDVVEYSETRFTTTDDDVKLVLNRAILVSKIYLANLKEFQEDLPERKMVAGSSR